MNDFDFKINEHFETFKNAQPNPGGWPGSNPRTWFDWVAKMSNTTLRPSCLSDSVSREAIFEMVADKSVDTASCCTAILAWGGMNRKHGMLLYSPEVVGENSPGDWLSLACDVRNGQHERKDAYDQFIRLRASKTPSGDTGLPGMGPAYFTKLIFFLMPENMKRGYIMDQWTAASTNLLSGGTMIHLQRSYPKRKSGARYVQESVSDKNDSNVYEKYCQFVEFLADQFEPQRDPCVIEEMMFSKGGKNKDSWRGHVVRTRQEASADALEKFDYSTEW